MPTPRLRTGVLASITALTIPLALLVPPANAAVTTPPSGDHSILVFPERDFVAVDGWTENNLTVNVLRGGFVVGTATGLNPVNGLVEINHAGPPCWQGVTPDIRAGDVVEVLTAPNTGESTLTYDVKVTEPATDVAGTVTIHGTAGTPAAPLPLADLEARIIAPGGAFAAADGGRSLRAPGEGSLTYDAAGSNAWTATFPGLSPADLSLATSSTSESRIMRIGGLLPNEATIFEFGVFGGPSPGCTAPAATGPSVPDLAAASDSGVSATDNITKNTTVGFAGVRGLAASNSVSLYLDGSTTPTATTTPGAGGAYSFPDVTLTPGVHQVTAGERDTTAAPAAPDTMSAASLTVTVDTSVPGLPQVTATDPVSPHPLLTPKVKGIPGASATDAAEDTSKVSIYDNAGCTGTPLGSGTGQVFRSTGVPTTVPDGSTTIFRARTEDLAGNLSGCSTTSQQYVQDNVVPTAPVLGVGSPSGAVSSKDATFAFSSDEPDVTFKCSLDGGTAADCVSPKSYPALSEGPHTFSVTATDPAGHVSDPSVRNWTVDTIAPVSPAMGTGIPSGLVSSRQATFSFGHNEPDVTFTCSLDGALATACVSPVTYLKLSQGKHSLAVTAADAAGHLSPGRVAGWTVDTKGPKVVGRNPGKNAKNVTPGKTLKVTLGEKVTGATARNVKVFAAGSNKASKALVRYSSTTNTITIDPRSPLQSGTRYSVELGRGIKDLAGNRLNPTLWRFTTRS